MQYVRIYPGPDGESHFADVEAPMAALATGTAGHLTGQSDALTGLLHFNSTANAAEAVGEWGNWHNAPRRQFVIWLQGELDIEVSDGEVRRFGPAMILLVDDTTGKGHRNRPRSALKVSET
ncbi:MAG: cupin domain-containing protein [Dehalococcoidia bacterium]